MKRRTLHPAFVWVLASTLVIGWWGSSFLGMKDPAGFPIVIASPFIGLLAYALWAWTDPRRGQSHDPSPPPLVVVRFHARYDGGMKRPQFDLRTLLIAVAAIGLLAAQYPFVRLVATETSTEFDPNGHWGFHVTVVKGYYVPTTRFAVAVGAEASILISWFLVNRRQHHSVHPL